MKSLFILLVVVNLLVFGFEYQRRQQAPKQDVQLELPDGVKRLRLVREKESVPSEIVAKTGEDVATPESGEGERLAGEPDHSSELPGEPLTQTPGDEHTAESTPNSGAEPEQQGEPSLVGKVESALELEPGSSSSTGLQGVDVSEPASASHAGMDSAAPSDTGPADQPSPSGRCFTLGAFKKLGEAESVADRIESLVVDMDGRQETGEKQIGYWVLIPAQGSRQAARNKVKELLDAGIEDVWRFTKGELANAISLGLFSNRGPAERHQREIARKGFATEVRPRYIQETSYWLDFGGSDDQVLPPEVEQALIRDYPGVALSSRECPPDAIP